MNITIHPKDIAPIFESPRHFATATGLLEIYEKITILPGEFKYLNGTLTSDAAWEINKEGITLYGENTISGHFDIGDWTLTITGNTTMMKIPAYHISGVTIALTLM